MPNRDSHEHVTDEQLLLFADGEGRGRQTQTVGRHVESCWSCRSRYQKMQSAIAEYAGLRRKTDTVVPPKGWREFDLRLDEVEAEENQRFSWRRWVGQNLIPRPRMRLKLASGLAALCCLLLVYRTVNAPAVLAKELCERAEAAERSLLSSDQVLRERLQVQASGGGLDRAVTETVETWRSASGEWLRHEAVKPLPATISQVLDSNGMAGMSPLSARSFSVWRDSVRPSREQVTRSWRSGEGQVYEVLTQIARAPDPWRIRESRLTVRASDWLPLALAWTVATPMGDRRIEITTIEREIVAANHLDSLLASRSTEAPSPAISEPLAPQPSEALSANAPAAPATADLDALEIDAGYVIHRQGLCYGGSVEVRRENDRVIVRGIVPAVNDLEALVDLLPGVPELSVELRSIEELDATIPAGSSEEPPAIIATSSAGRLPIEKHLRDYFTENGAVDVNQDVADYLHNVVRLTHAVRREAWALRRVTERHRGRPTDGLEFAQRRKLEMMISDHTAQLHAQTRRSRELLTPVLNWCIARIPADSVPPPPAENPGSSWSDRALDLAVQAERLGRLVRGVFVGQAAEPVTLSTSVRGIAASLDHLERDSAATVAALDDDFLYPSATPSHQVGIQ